ncbi:hypothetical protein AAG570_010202 [Ranatra chinensis]|uniref:Uncharacterized protein n=1 Tax=Ranatra chinensis TaxID=642074 RepID=A0ABD0YLV2_9HEMI
MGGGLNVSLQGPAYPNSTIGGGDIHDAYVTMKFHRSMMNEYLCRGYLADEILAEVGKRAPAVERRQGLPAKPATRRKQTKDKLIEDEGSSGYKDWLTRSTLMNDIYRHYDQVMSAGGSAEDEGDSLSIESGEVTGYAVQGDGGKAIPSAPSYHHHQLIPAGVGVDSYHHHYPSSSGKKGLSLKDLFDLALTALAFLAFGLFIKHLILTCIMGPIGPVVVMNTTTTTTTARSSGESSQDDSLLNDLAYRVLTSIDRMVQLYEAKTGSSGRCLKYTLCDNNRYSRSLRDPKTKIWLPVWSFGVSWIMGRLGEDRLEGLRAAVLGLANANCKRLYPFCTNEDSN